jgi:hypothetical protein
VEWHATHVRHLRLNNGPDRRSARIAQVKLLHAQDSAWLSHLQDIVLVRIVQLVISQDDFSVDDDVDNAIRGLPPRDVQHVALVQGLHFEVSSHDGFFNCLQTEALKQGLPMDEGGHELPGLVTLEDLHFVGLEVHIQVLALVVQHHDFLIIGDQVFNSLT